MFVVCFKQKTAYEMRISGWSSDVCSSDLRLEQFPRHRRHATRAVEALAQICARGLDVGEQRQIVAVIGEVAGGEIDAGVARHRHDMRLRVARSAGHGEQADRVEKTRADRKSVV